MTPKAGPQARAIPQMSGRELAAKLRAQLPGLPCLYVSGHPLDLDANENTALLLKPFTINALATAVSQLLQRSATSIEDSHPGSADGHLGE